MNSSDLDRLNSNLDRHEDLRLLPYDDATGKTLKRGDVIKGNITIGIGINLSEDGITSVDAYWMRDAIVNQRIADLRNNLPNFDGFSGPRQAALVEMAYTMGIPRLLGFKKMVSALRRSPIDWNVVADEALDSNWAKHEAPARAMEIATVLRAGIWQS